MALQRGVVKGYDYDRMVVEFTMLDEKNIIPCAVSTGAMDDLEGRRNIASDLRVEQFMRLRQVVEDRASDKFLEQPNRGNGRVVLRSNDFPKI